MRHHPWLVASMLLAAPALAGPIFKVSFDAATRAEPATGRLVVYLVDERSGIRGEPAGEHWDNPQPMYGVDVKGVAPGAAATVDDAATSFPAVLSRLPQGKYRVQAVLDVHQDDSAWRREPGNLYSEPTTVELGATDGPTEIPIALTKVVGPRPLPTIPGVEWFEVRSKLLSEFHGRDIMLRAGVSLPSGFDPKADRKYAAVYEVPGFGGDHTDVRGVASQRRVAMAGSAQAVLARNTFWIVLDPESGNGHTLFADSANNGPCGRALTTELIPALEAKYPLVPEAKARLLRGHSSGGWSTLWLALTYPETFGATWSTSPDPVDFHRFQLPDIYDDANMYARDGKDLPSYRGDGKERMTIRQENLMEEVLGPDNTSGQQWDSWMAVWGPRNSAGHPAALYDPVTGAIDRAVAERYRAYDITERLRAEPGKYGLVLLQRCRVVVGDKDSFYLNEAVARLKSEAEKLSFLQFPEGAHGCIKILPGFDHGSIFGSPELNAIPQEMVDHLTGQGLIGS
jgi:S-formylglutathione hydrolase FrmB